MSKTPLSPTLPQHEKPVYTVAEFAGLFGRHKSWAYRLIYAQRIKVIHKFGKMMVPASEADEILSAATHYGGA